MTDITLGLKRYYKAADGSEVPYVRVDGAAVIAAASATHTDRSGSITVGGTAQTLMAANSARMGLWVQNLSTGDLYISGQGTASATQPSLRIPPGALYEAPWNGVGTTAISIFGATTGQAFSAREW